MSETLHDIDVSSELNESAKGIDNALVEKVSTEVATERAHVSKASIEVVESDTKTTRKRNLLTPKSVAEKRVKVEVSELKPASTYQVELVYQTIKAIKMPRRSGTGPPSKDDKPYGPAETHENSMLIYWLDEEDKSYNEATQLYAEKFPKQKAVEEAIRRRHIRALQRLAKIYGAKAIDEIDGVGKNALRRGKKRGPRLARVRADSPPQIEDTAVRVDYGKTTPGSSSPAYAGASTKLAGHVPQYVKQQSFKAIEKAAIVVWKDLEGKDFKEIREKLDEEYNWSLGRGTVEKFYHLTRPKVYGALNGRAVNREDETPAEQEVAADESTSAEDSIVEHV
jgi:hypothetical protein